MKLPRRMMVSSSALLVLLLALLDASAAANTTDDGTTTTTPPPPTPAPWGMLATGCESDKADKAAATPEYAACAKDSGFSFDLSLNRRVTENVFCRSTNCLKLFRTLRGISSDARRCANVGGLESVPLDTRSGATNCFGPAATDDSVNVIVRPGDQSSSGSGGAGETKKPTTAPPKPTTPVPTTPEPTTLAPETTSPMPTSAPKPTTKKPRTGSGSGSRGAPIGSVVATPAPSTPTDMSNKKSDSGGLDSGTVVAIIGVSVGVVAVIIALVFVSTRKPKRRKKSNPHNSTHSRETVSHEQLTSYYGDPTNMRSGSYVPPRPTERASALVLTGGGGRGSMPWHSDGFGTAFAGWDEELIQAVRIPYEKLAFDELLSRGGYGEVYRGTYRGEPVAIKTLLPERRRDMQQIQSFLAEVKMMANMEHERIVHFIGVAWDSLEELSVVSEFLERGDLRTVLAGFERDRIRPHGFDADKIKIALHVAHGLTYMHTLQPVVLHRDLKSRNILLDNQLNAKITDFGVSRERSDSTMTAGVGSSLWMAPEVMMGERYDEKADIFSLGVVLSELDNHVLPYSHAIERNTGRRMPDPVILQMVSLGRMRVAFTDEAQSEMAQIGIRCVALSPRDRPTAAELLHLIHQASRRN